MKKGHGETWTPYEDLVLREGAECGASYAEIATKLGKTRNAIAGRAHRLGLVFKCDHRSAIVSRYMLERWREHKRWCAIDPTAPLSLRRPA